MDVRARVCTGEDWPGVGEPLHVVIGGRGLIGTALVHELASRDRRYWASSRDRNCAEWEFFLDLTDPTEVAFPADMRPTDIVYLVAAMPGFAACEGNAQSWRINVDAQIALARWFKRSFVVFVSSDSVEWAGGTAYARQKAQVESYIQSIDGAIVRPARVTPPRAAEFARCLVDVALQRKIGVTRWA
jgi:dTDP-4-dehydrorhamnose reductase